MLISAVDSPARRHDPAVGAGSPGVEYLAALGHRVQPCDRVALARAVGIPCGREHDAQRRSAIPLGVAAIERAVGRVQQQFDQVRLQPQHHRLRLRIAKPAIELQRARIARGIDHHAGVEKPRVGSTFVRHALDRRQDDLAHDARVHLRSHDRRGRVCAHAARVGPLIVVEQALVILR